VVRFGIINNNLNTKSCCRTCVHLVVLMDCGSKQLTIVITQSGELLTCIFILDIELIWNKHLLIVVRFGIINHNQGRRYFNIKSFMHPRLSQRCVIWTSQERLQLGRQKTRGRVGGTQWRYR
jgi:hypothetical protein